MNQRLYIGLCCIGNPFGDYGRIFIQLFREPFITSVFLCENDFDSIYIFRLFHFGLLFTLPCKSNEFILLAFLKLRKQDFPGAQKWLAHIKNPEAALVKKQQGYFNYLHGLMVSQTNLNEAERYFKKAITLGLSMDQDLALAKLQLAGIAMTRRRKLEATNLLNEAKKLDKQNMLIKDKYSKLVNYHLLKILKSLELTLQLKII